jgi:DNA-binding IscR family transcriptional regulator
MLWVLNQSDGAASLLDIAQKSGLPLVAIENAARRLETAGLLKEHESRASGGGRGTAGRTRKKPKTRATKRSSQ